MIGFRALRGFPESVSYTQDNSWERSQSGNVHPMYIYPYFNDVSGAIAGDQSREWRCTRSLTLVNVFAQPHYYYGYSFARYSSWRL